MASSSVSQESLDREDIDISNRRYKVRMSRPRVAANKGDKEGIGDHSVDTLRDQNGDRTDHYSGTVGDDLEGVNRVMGSPATSSTTTTIGGVDHESPTRAASSRAKDKRTRPNHLHKGKPPKDKRKLREKRRSTGVVHLPSTESTGDSLDDEDEGDKIALETKRNTTFNEVIHADNRNSTMASDDHVPKTYTARRTKSPSDLDADLEDNQDYDSAVSQSETNLTLIGQSEPASSGAKTSYKPYRSSRSPYSPPSSSFRVLGSDQESKTPTCSNSSSSSSSVMSRYKEIESGKNPREPTLQSQIKKRDLHHCPDSDYQRPVSSQSSQVQDSWQSQSTYNQSHLPSLKENPNYNVKSYKENWCQGSQQQQSQEEYSLDKLLNREREENRRLIKLLDDKDRRIAELEKEIALLNKDVEAFEDENETLQVENRALINAFSQLSTTV
ncbi:PRKC apoptosis WT1 regulator protein isoform X4 [Octopus bimaculoides]|uniref:PRKC apoptosis WT1 regulator protein isoform X4 n=1 Tax=Octopus bimaculoides TaxID=37653 RepID=UPI00071DD315|nr:PRKC apoptosis WT1 regulator protein isoform X4 [Octopus bimaculoides]|eukprot:XP_014771238.1 PREDICTED: PRKC apoptosis WT1 regulator protein-like isoform X4 [Octopus bimaculoides]